MLILQPLNNDSDKYWNLEGKPLFCKDCYYYKYYFLQENLLIITDVQYFCSNQSKGSQSIPDCDERETDEKTEGSSKICNLKDLLNCHKNDLDIQKKIVPYCYISEKET